MQHSSRNEKSLKIKSLGWFNRFIDKDVYKNNLLFFNSNYAKQEYLQEDYNKTINFIYERALIRSLECKIDLLSKFKIKKKKIQLNAFYKSIRVKGS
jgi:hypothetical protein